MVREDSALPGAFPGFVLLRLRGLDEPFQLRMARAASTDRRRFFAAADVITLLEMYARDDRCILDKFLRDCFRDDGIGMPLVLGATLLRRPLPRFSSADIVGR